MLYFPDLRIKELQKSVAPWNPISKAAKYNNMLSINIDATVENKPIINEWKSLDEVPASTKISDDLN